MNIRRATTLDEAVLRELWEEFEREVPEPPGSVPETWEEEWPDVRRDIEEGAVLLAEDDEGPAGTARITAPKRGRSHIHLVHVRPRARRQGLAKALVLACVQDAKAKGATRIELDVLTTNSVARSVWSRMGFEEVVLGMAAPLETLEHRLEGTQIGASRGSVHVQTDDDTSVQRAVAQFVPRLVEPEVAAAADGWIRIRERLFDDDRDAQSRFARDLSDRLGAVVVALALEHGSVVRFRIYESGRMVDEYLSVPSFHGQLSKGDELALEANPTLVARLTGADRDTVREVMRTASSPADLPPAEELYEAVARTMGLEP
jgi:N6-L-threonylcarbamoyladenine synthase/ribosomal-protein-alanine N-acetyltransferase